ncbi:hypothetical protein C2E23DRAFT_883270 [Lenzites betulinus]|nr:hypothetical protein C2E23DRAFT_883270 [Lenzites betulinus]
MQGSQAPSWTPLRLTSLSAVPASESPAFVTFPPAKPGASVTQPGAARKRYSKEVYELLSDYFYNVNQYSTKADRIKLAQQVAQMPGAGDYTHEKVHQYFASKRQSKAAKASRQTAQPAQSSASPPAPPSSAHILYPSLATDRLIIPKLDVLLNETPKPTPSTAKIWAAKLGPGVQPGDITTYAELRLAQVPGKLRIHSPSQLPTPNSSLSPEPLKSPVSPVVETSWGKVDPDDVKDELYSDYEDELEEIETKFVPPPEDPVPRTDPRLVSIANDLHQAWTCPSSPREGGKPPKSLGELSRWFQTQQPVAVPTENSGKPRPRQWTDTTTKPPQPPHATVGGRTLA